MKTIRNVVMLVMMTTVIYLAYHVVKAKIERNQALELRQQLSEEQEKQEATE